MKRRLGTYVNGNTVVAIYNDGSKERYLPNDEPAAPDFPESIDLKITDKCDLGCAMCHECSTPDGDHADLSDPILNTLHPHTELAIGGGNPLEHPDLPDFLRRTHSQGVICNVTVNAVHFMKNIDYLRSLVDECLVYGLGISIPSVVPEGFFDAVQEFPNAVIHTIAGITPIDVFRSLADRNLNLLILGYKYKGRGENLMNRYPIDIYTNIFELEKNVMTLPQHFRNVGFDNLAVKQLVMKDKLADEQWDNLYLGDDGEFTMYIDLVKRMAAKSSTHEAFHFSTDSIDQLFHQIKTEGDRLK